jgi:hypothetical protein
MFATLVRRAGVQAGMHFRHYMLSMLQGCY